MSPELDILKRPGYCGGHPTVGDTRIRVHNVVGSLRLYDGDIDALLRDYTNWTREQVEAALAYYREHPAEIDAILRRVAEDRAARLRAAAEERRTP